MNLDKLAAALHDRYGAGLCLDPSGPHSWPCAAAAQWTMDAEAISAAVLTARPDWLPRDLVGAAMNWAHESDDQSPAAQRLRTAVRLVGEEPDDALLERLAEIVWWRENDIAGLSTWSWADVKEEDRRALIEELRASLREQPRS